ncbi:hypothetical protein Tco_0577487 [Tanacetum coccineum]
MGRLHMMYSEEDILILAISMCLGVLFIFIITGTIWESLVKKLMMDFFLGYSPMDKAFRCPGNTEYIPYIHAYENTTPSKSPILQVFVTFEDPPEFTEADNHPALNEPDQTESDDLFKPVELTNNIALELFSDVILSPTIPPSPEVILQTLVPQNRWSREKHIELVNIIGEPLAGITTRSRNRDSDAASASECLYVNFLSEMEPKKLIEALEEEGWISVYAKKSE